MNIQQFALNTPRRITTARDRDCRDELSKSVSTYLFTFSKKSKRNTVEAAHHRSTPDDRQQQKTPGCCLLSCHPVGVGTWLDLPKLKTANNSCFSVRIVLDCSFKNCFSDDLWTS